MSYKLISGIVPQLRKRAGGASASGYYLKAYEAGTTTSLSMGIDQVPSATLAKCKLNTLGEPISNSNDESSVFIPAFNAVYKLALYRNSTDADNNTTANALWVVDDIDIGTNITALDIPLTIDGVNTNVSVYLNSDSVESYSDLQAIDVTKVNDFRTVNVTARANLIDGGGGRFYWTSIDKSSEVAGDPRSGIYVPPSSDETGASGSWIRLIGQSEEIDAAWFGVISTIDGDSGATDTANAAINTAAFEGAVGFAQFSGKRTVAVGAGLFKTNGIQLAYHSTNAPGLNPERKSQRTRLVGVGQMDDGEAIVFVKTDTYPTKRTIIESINSTPAITVATDLTQYPIRCLEISQLTAVSDNLGAVINIDGANTNSALLFVTYVQKNGSGHGLRWYNGWMYSIRNIYGINIADTVNSGSIGMELKNMTASGGMIDLQQVTMDSFGINYVFGERNFETSAGVISGIAMDCVQGLKGVVNFEFVKGCVNANGNMRSEQAGSKGVRFYNFCRDISITNLRCFNPDATVCDVEFGVETDTSTAKNGHANINILCGQADVNNTGVIRRSGLDSDGGSVEKFRLFQALGTGSGTGMSGGGNAPNGFTVDLILDSTLTTPLSGMDQYINPRVTKDVIQIASAATITLPDYGNSIELTGSTPVTDITPVVEGMELVIYSSLADITDVGNLKLAGNYTASIYSMIVLQGRNGNWREKTRSINT